jgi:small-conductance mechanosensitive channel
VPRQIIANASAARVAFALILSAVLALLLPSPAWAQGRPQTSTTASPDPVPVPVAEILTRVDEDHRFLEGVERRLQPGDPGEALAGTLKNIADSVDERLRLFSVDALRRMPVVRLESLHRQWLFDERRLRLWQQQMRTSLQPDAEDAEQLSWRRRRWEATLARLTLDDDPAPLAQRVHGLLDEITTVEQRLAEPLQRQITLSREAAAVEARLIGGGNEVVQAIADVDARLLRTDAPPIWRATPAAATTAASDPATTSPMQALEIEARFSTEYAEANSPTRRVLGALQLVVFPLLIGLAWRGRRARRDSANAGSDTGSGSGSGSDDRYAWALSRPISAWIVLSMLMVLALEPGAPLLASEVALLIALIPTLRVVQARTDAFLSTWTYSAVGLYVLDRASLLLQGDAALYRLALLAVDVLALALTVWGLLRLRAAGPAVTRGDLLERMLSGPRARLVAGLIAVLLLAAIVANVLGNVSFGEMMTRTIVDGAYFALLLHAGVSITLALLRGLQPRSPEGGRSLLRDHGRAAFALVAKALQWSAAAVWAYAALQDLRLLRPAQAAITAVLALRMQLGEITISLGHVVLFVLLVLGSIGAARGTRVVLREQLRDRVSLPRGADNSIASLSYYALLLVGVFVAFSAAGVELSQLALVFGALGVGIGFGLQNIVNNFVSGLVLMVERPIQPGDTIEVPGASGTVRSIGMRATIIRTFDGADVVVPNGTLLSANLTNWTMLDRARRIELEVGLRYGSDPRRVIALLEEVARGHADLSARPAPQALLRTFGDSALVFVLRAWVEDVDRWTVIRSELMCRVLEALDQAGLDIPFTQYDVTLRTLPGPTQDAGPAKDAGPGG